MPETIHDFTTEDLRKLNSATQYPSIPTYHVLGERGRLTEHRTADFSAVGPIEVTEKLDGTNARIIVPPLDMGSPFIGSRTELLHYLDDLVPNPALGIVDATRDVADGMRHLDPIGAVMVVFGEVFGGKTSAGAKNYSTAGTVGFRVFDIAAVPLHVLDSGLEQIAAWRDSGGQRFHSADELRQTARLHGFSLVPRLAVASPLPVSVADTYGWLTAVLDTTFVGLDGTGTGRPEGVVVRTPDRSRIAKIRFEDYERTLKVKTGRR